MLFFWLIKVFQGISSGPDFAVDTFKSGRWEEKQERGHKIILLL